jgi:predicted nucleic acid-binding Zn ribbon protein
MRRRRQSEPTAIRDLLSRWLVRRGMARELGQYRIWVRWPELVGERVAARTEPGALKNGKLTIRVASAAWLNELSLMRADLVRRINAGLGEELVREVRLLAGSPRQSEPERRRAAPLASEDKRLSDAEPPPALLAEIEQAAGQIGDPELREVARRAGLARLRSRRTTGGR